MSCHNYIKYGVADLARKSLLYTHMNDVSLVHICHAVKSGRAPPARSNQPNKKIAATVDSNQKGYLLIQYLQQKVTDYILDMNAVNTYATFYLQKSPDRIILTV